MEYDPVIIPQTRVPHIAHAWPKLGAQHIEFDKINNRSDIELGFPMPVSVGDVIPRMRVDKATITGPDGVTWEPVGGGQFSRIVLRRDEAHPYERGGTYRVHIEVTFIVAPDSPQVYDYEFRVDP